MFEVMKHKIHGPLESGSSVLETKRHFSIDECTPRTNECRFVLVLGFDLDLVIAQETIHERKGFTTSALINDLVDEWSWIIVFWTRLVQIMEIGTDTNCALFFIDWHRI
jgi:hypothetical protein